MFRLTVALPLQVRPGNLSTPLPRATTVGLVARAGCSAMVSIPRPARRFVIASGTLLDRQHALDLRVHPAERAEDGGEAVDVHTDADDHGAEG